MTALEMWLEQATRDLSSDAAERVRAEIAEHFEAARVAAMQDGENETAAEKTALAALGDAKMANRQYRRVLLTKREAQVLRQSGWDAQADYERGWLRWFVLFWTVVTVASGLGAWTAGYGYLSGVLLIPGIALAMCGIPMFFKIFTPRRSRVYRAAKWLYLVGVAVIAWSAFKHSVLFIVCVSIWPSLSIGWTRMSIRRKMPVSEWPKHLYL
ncbi:MAG TPA: hypothetical protein VE291_01855 [Terracidiphilus sp.]|nr:hypothetical protein [Terracidiphilus sp.]